MKERPGKERLECDRFLEEMETTRAEKGQETTAEVLLGAVNEAARAHAGRCGSCREAVEELVLTRNELARLAGGMPEPGPWFTARVMGAIQARESEIEEKKNGVWNSVRRLAPRLVAFCTLLLVLGGTWALELRQAEQAKRAEMRSVEGLFESTLSTPLNDDVMANTRQESRP